jgi:hypothetical protein
MTDEVGLEQSPSSMKTLLLPGTRVFLIGGLFTGAPIWRLLHSLQMATKQQEEDVTSAVEALQLLCSVPVLFAPTRATQRLGYFPCPIRGGGEDGFCPHAYLRKGDLKVHMERCHSEEECGAFPQLMRPRSPVGKPFPCPFPQCEGKHAYRRKRGLRRHVLAHHPNSLR